MPNPNHYKDKQRFMNVCIRQVMREGKKHSEAVAQCQSMWERAKGEGGDGKSKEQRS